MSDRAIVMHTLQCDRCGRLASDDEAIAMAEYSQAESRWESDEYGWVKIRSNDGIGDYCPDCYEVGNDGNWRVRGSDDVADESGHEQQSDRSISRDFGGYDWQDHPWQW